VSFLKNTDAQRWNPCEHRCEQLMSIELR
jgi:hypothetical protein